MEKAPSVKLKQTFPLAQHWNGRAQDTYGTLETHREAEDGAIQYANQRAKCLRLRNLAEREGFEPSVQVLARTTV
jgi:hypothetical protein